MIDDRRDSWAFSLFADDLRHEVGGKMSVIGLYQADYIFQGTFPHVIPKLAIFILYYEIEGKLTDDFAFRIFLPGDNDKTPSIEVPFKRSEMPEIGLPDNVKLEAGQEPLRHLRIPLIFSPLVIKEPGPIKVRLRYSGGKLLRIGALNIRAADVSKPSEGGVSS